MRRWSPPPTTLRRWHVGAPTQVTDFEIFQIEKAPLQDPDGNPKHAVHTMRTRDWCNVIAITPRNEIVLVRQYRFGTQEFSLEVPGGVIDEGEAPAIAAARELAEESGYSAPIWESLSVVHPNPAISSNRLHSFIAKDATASAICKFDELEELEVVLVAREHLGALLDDGHVPHALCALALHQYLRRTA
jgi:ADP-ribose pyrophosphatase